MLDYYADDLRKKNIKKKVLYSEYLKILKIINEKIIETYKLGNEKLTIKVPNYFPNIPLDNNISYTYIYSNCIKTLNKYGYNIKIHINKNITILFISWEKYNDIEYNNMKDIIKKNLYNYEIINKKE